MGVDGHHPAPRFECQVEEVVHMHDSGAVHQHVHAAGVGEDLGDGRVDQAGVRHVAHVRPAVAARGFHRSLGRCQI